MLRGGARGGLGGLQRPRRRHLAPPPPVGGNSGFSSEEIWQDNARKHHFSVILAPLSEAPVPLSEKFLAPPLYVLPSAVGQSSCAVAFSGRSFEHSNPKTLRHISFNQGHGRHLELGGHNTPRALFSFKWGGGHFLKIKGALLCLLQNLGGTCSSAPQFLRIWL